MRANRNTHTKQHKKKEEEEQAEVKNFEKDIIYCLV